MRIHCFETGRVRPKRAARGPRRYLPGGWSEETLPVNAFLVEHPAGLCLFDTGQTARARNPGYHSRWHPYLRLARFELGPEDELAAQLAAAGFAAADVRWIVLSHLHTDHVGGVGSFPAAHVLVSTREWKRAQAISGRLRGYLPQHWPRGIEPECVDLERGPHDVAGDGTLEMMPLPGHTPGHAGLLVERRVLLAGDADDAPAGVIVLRAHDPEAGSLVT